MGMVLLRMRFLLLSALASIALLVPIIVSAQSFGGTAPLTLTTSPQYPAPYGQAIINPLSDTLDLASVTFVLSVNGKEFYRGNAKPVAVTLGAAGSMTNVKGTITGGGTSYSQTLSIQPEDVALVVEPISSAPPLYLGKPLVPLEGNVRIIAVANLRTSSGAALDPNTLSYSWTVDGIAVTASSGIGKASVIAKSPLQYRASDISVAVTSPDGSLVGGAALTLSPEEPTLRIYENDPLLGIRFDHALSGSYAISGSEVALYGAPYSFPTSAGNPLLQWFLNGSSAQTGAGITLRPTGTGSGTANISVTSSSGDSTVAASLSLSFGSSSSTNIFGL